MHSSRYCILSTLDKLIILSKLQRASEKQVANLTKDAWNIVTYGYCMTWLSDVDE